MISIKRLQQEYKEYLKNPNYFYNINPRTDNFYIWDILLIGPPDSPFESGIFKCQFTFPKEYPNKPPKFTFISNLPHPNIYKNGEVCISILHEGEDVFGYEKTSERWTPSHSVDSILMSIITMLPNPNFESPANTDISKLWKNDYTSYKKIIYNLIANQ